MALFSRLNGNFFSSFHIIKNCQTLKKNDILVHFKGRNNLAIIFVSFLFATFLSTMPFTGLTRFSLGILFFRDSLTNLNKGSKTPLYLIKKKP
jgi:hypothetical protein